jgi:hypothetical protein
MAPKKSNSNHLPDPNRIQTRPKNATAHPGKVAMESLAVRRKTEEIEQEKRVKNERRQAREQKKVDSQAAVLDIAEYEDKMVVDDAEEKLRFPRRKLMGELAIDSNAGLL